MFFVIGWGIIPILVVVITVGFLFGTDAALTVGIWLMRLAYVLMGIVGAWLLWYFCGPVWALIYVGLVIIIGLRMGPWGA